MSQQQTPSRVSTANQQPLHELRQGNLPALTVPSKDSHVKRLPKHPVPDCRRSSSEHFLSFHTLSGASPVCAGKERTLCSNGRQNSINDTKV